MLSLLASAPAADAQPASVSPASGDSLTEAEKRVQEIISREGIHVVHFWAPWCDNSISELRNGWYELIEQNEDVTFTFVTVWNDGRDGSAELKKFAIPDHVLELTLPDYGPSEDKSRRRYAFLNLPLTWIPSTWIFQDSGKLAFALNYGEMEIPVLQQLIDVARKDWKY